MVKTILRIIEGALRIIEGALRIIEGALRIIEGTAILGLVAGFIILDFMFGE